MYDFIDFSQGTNFYLNLYCFLLYCVLLLISLRGNVIDLYGQDSYNGRRLILFCGILLFALTSFVGADFFHYYENMALYKAQVFGDQETGLELFYQYLIYYTNGNYFLFRLVVWGASLVSVVLAAHRFGVNVYHTLFVIFAGYIVTFSYARATMAMSAFSLGAIIVCTAIEPKKKYVPIIIGLSILVSSIYFHRSMLPMMAITLLWLLLPCKRFLSKYSLWLFPILVFACYLVMKSTFEELFAIADTIEDETGMLDKAELYTEKETVTRNLMGNFRLLLHYSTFYFPLILLSNIFRSDSALQKIGKRGVWLYQLVYIIFVFATSFLFMDIDADTFFYRYLYMTFIPLSILIVYLKDKRVLTMKPYLWIVACFIVYNLFQLFAEVYSVM